MKQTTPSNAKALSLVYTYFNNPLTLDLIFRRLERLPKSLKVQIELIVVDDASTAHPATDIQPPAGISSRVFVSTESGPWNHRAARNIGCWEALSPRLLLLDVDMLPTQQMLHFCLTTPLSDHLWLFGRQCEHSGKELNAHHDTILISTPAYWRLRGYDEAYRGYWGVGPLFLKRAKKLLRREVAIDYKVKYLGNLPELDSQTDLRRKQSIFRRLSILALRLTHALRLRKHRVMTMGYREDNWC